MRKSRLASFHSRFRLTRVAIPPNPGPHSMSKSLRRSPRNNHRTRPSNPKPRSIQMFKSHRPRDHVSCCTREVSTLLAFGTLSGTYGRGGDTTCKELYSITILGSGVVHTDIRHQLHGAGSPSRKTETDRIGEMYEHHRSGHHFSRPWKSADM